MGQGTAVYEFLIRWAHYVGGISWMGFLFYLNFVQAEYLRVASHDARADNYRKLMPMVVEWFRYGSLATLFTGLAILSVRWGNGGWANWSYYTVLGVVIGLLLFLNVWISTIPNMLITIGKHSGDVEKAMFRGLLAARTNLLFSGPMLFFMGASSHLPSPPIADVHTSSIVIIALILTALELNGLRGRLGPLASASSTAGSSIALTFVLVMVSNTF